MAITMYQASVPAFKVHLSALDGLIDKAVAYADARKIDHAALLSARLYPDMFTFTRQVQVACDFAKGAVARLANIEVPNHADTETTFAELKGRIAKVLAFIETVKPEQMEGAEGRTISLKVGPNEMTFAGADYLLGFVLPNFYFHSATAYGLLRHNGLEIGKRDFMRRVS